MKLVHFMRNLHRGDRDQTYTEFRDAFRSSTNVDPDCLCRNRFSWRIDRNCTWSVFGSCLPFGQPANLIDAILRHTLVKLASCSALDQT